MPFDVIDAVYRVTNRDAVYLSIAQRWIRDLLLVVSGDSTTEERLSSKVVTRQRGREDQDEMQRAVQRNLPILPASQLCVTGPSRLSFT